ncbi:GapS6b family protein [Rahnella sikkimica]|uniref:Uncharacterized protein n=1 Tax=Rahnella sikkimica TaxID=1805933 RepID=A0A2L1UYV3_9GAMM|nr:hypothetical protein [Rahnella sikkimica]AVF38110.1 hypothetical protein BV494_24765 [Rahnella sikkimica]
MIENTQIHHGRGDNVWGSKLECNIENIYITSSTVIPENLREPIQTILNLLSNRSIPEAREKIQFISSIANLSEDVRSLLHLINVRCSIIENANHHVDLGILYKIIRSTEDLMIKDLAISLALRASLRQEGEEEARNRLEGFTVSGNNTQAVKYELFTEKHDLLTLAKNNKYQFSEEELVGLVAGLMRVECSTEARNIAEYLKKTYANNNSTVIFLYTQALSLNPLLSNTDYWLLSQESKNEVECLINNIVSFMATYHGNDIRMFNIIVPIYIFTKEQSNDLRKLCLENLDLLKIIYPDFAAELKSLFFDEPFNENNKMAVVRRCKSDEEYRLNFVDEISSKTNVETSDFLMAKDVLTPDELSNWVLKGVEIIGSQNILENNFSKLCVKLSINGNGSESVREILKFLSEFDGDFEGKLSSMFILKVASMLCATDLPEDACDIMAKYIGRRENLWCSPLIEQYLINLYSCGRYLDFHNAEKNIIDTDKPTFVFCQLMESYLYHSMPERAEEVIARVKDTSDLQFIVLKLMTFDSLRKNLEAENVINTFDFSVIISHSPTVFNFLCILAKLNRYDLIELISVNLFLISPEKNAKFVSDVGNHLMIGPEREKHVLSSSLDDCLCGVQYIDSGSTFTKLILNNQPNQNLYFLSNISLIGKALLSAEVGVQVMVGNKLITLQEKLPPYVAVYRMASAIRHESNDGSDAFQIIHLPRDPDKMVEAIKNFFPISNETSMMDFQESIFLSIQACYLEKNDSVKSALQLLTHKRTKYIGFINEGELLSGGVSSDIVTVVYLCLTSLSQHFVNQGVTINLIEEDINSLRKWLDDIDNKSYMSMNVRPGGELSITTSETLELVFKTFIKNLKRLLPSITPLTLQITNSTNEFRIISKMTGPVYMKSLYALKSSNLPFFTIDTQVANYLKYRSGNILSNTFSILLDAANNIEYSYREEAVLLHSISELPYILPPNDFISLCRSKDDMHGIYISSLINKYVKNFNEEIEINFFMASVFNSYLKKVSYTHWFSDSDILLGNTYECNPFGYNIDKVFNACCNAVLERNRNRLREDQFATFILILTIINGSGRITDFICHLATRYATGHFMNIKRINSILPALADEFNKKFLKNT